MKWVTSDRIFHHLFRSFKKDEKLPSSYIYPNELINEKFVCYIIADLK